MSAHNLPPSALFTPQAGVTTTHAGFVAMAPHSALQLSVHPTLPLPATAASAASTATFGTVSTVAGSSGTGAAAGGGWGGLNTAYRFATNNSGLENLGNGYDVEVPSHMDDPEGATTASAAATNSAAATGAARAAAFSAVQNPTAGRAYATVSTAAAAAVPNPSDAAANGGWFNGWRIEYAMNSNEHTALKHILAGSALPAGFDTYALIKKLFVGCSNVAAHADRFHATAQEVPKLKQRNAQLEDALRAARLRSVRGVGVCAHIGCENCLKGSIDLAVALHVDDASAQQYIASVSALSAGYTPVNANVVPDSTPVQFPIPNPLLRQHGGSQRDENQGELVREVSTSSGTDRKSVQHDKETVEERHVAALQLDCYAQSQLAQHSVSGVIASVTRTQWIVGVYILFESAVSRLFFDTFATTLHGKAGGVNVLVNASQRMLAVQLKGEPKTVIPKADSNHLLIKVATDGRFTLQVTPDIKSAASSGASSAAGLASAAGTGSAGSTQSIQSGAGSRVHPADGYAPLGGSTVAVRQQQPATTASAAAVAGAKPPTGPQKPRAISASRYAEGQKP